MVIHLAKSKLDRPGVGIVSNCTVGACADHRYQALFFCTFLIEHECNTIIQGVLLLAVLLQRYVYTYIYSYLR